jgi:hypothetical protein
VARTERGDLFPLPPRRPGEQTRISESMRPPPIKKEDQNQEDGSNSSSANTTAVFPNSTLALRVMPSSPGQVQAEQRHPKLAATMSGKESYRRIAKMPEKLCRKRAISPVDTLDSSFEGGSRHKYPRQTANSTHKVTDPRLQFRRA